MEPDYKEVERIIINALREDVGSGDATATLMIPESATATLSFVTREDITICGSTIIPRVFAELNKKIECKILVNEGQQARAGATLLTVHGPARDILTAERTALNLMQRMCAVATLAARYVKEVEGTGAIILDTRKTIPGLRILDKYAVRVGGGTNHRMRLDDGILIKDNHIALCGGIAAALRMAHEGNSRHLPIEIECDTLAQVEEALNAGATMILLDNMSNDQLRAAVAINKGRAVLEASGGVSLETVRGIAQTGVDRISVGCITHSAPNVDIGLDVSILN